MNPKKTLLFFLIFAFIGTYYYLIEIKKSEKTKEIEQEEKRVFYPVKKEKISEITVEKENKITVRIAKKDNTWKIKEPFESDIDKNSFDMWIDNVAKIKKVRVIAKSAENKTEFGLDPPSFAVRVKTDNGSVVTLESGDEIPTGGMFYSKLKSKDSIFLIATYSKSGINKSAYELRDKKIFHFENDDVQGIKISAATGNYSVEKKDDAWQLVEPKTAPADNEKITSLIQTTRTTDIKKFIDEEVEDMTPYGLKEPQTQIIFLVGKNKTPHVLAFGKKSTEDEGIYAKTSLRNKVFLLKKDFLDNFPYLVNDIRDKSIIRFDKNRINKIQFVSPYKTITAVKNEENNWEIIEPKKYKADNFEVNSLLNNINDAKVIDFIPKNRNMEDAFSLKNPRLSVKLFEQDDSQPGVISFGDDDPQGKAVYANTGDTEEVVLIEKELFSKLNISETTLLYKNLLVADEDKVARVQINAEGKEYILSKTKDEWTLEKPEKKTLKIMKVKNVLWNLEDIKFTEIVDESGKTDLADFGLQKPAIKVNLLDQNGNNLESLFIGTKIKDADTLFAMTDKSKTIYSIEQKLSDDLLNSIKALLK